MRGKSSACSTPAPLAPRLERLARFYGVGVDQLLPRDPQRVDDAGDQSAAPKKLRIDVGWETAVESVLRERLHAYLGT